jgi:hypothetical protein
VLTESIHNFKVRRSPQKGGSSGTPPGSHHARFQARIAETFKRYTWPPIKIENGCTGAPIGLPSVESSASASENASRTSSGRLGSAKSNASWYESVKSGGAQILPFTPTQDFVRHYFTPAFKLSGMLLWHSVGTGKTCTAIATASSSFEKEGYSVIYVTRHTLKGDVWKNMFDQVCSVILQERIQKQGLALPEAQAARMRLLQKRWLEPMSYRQFSNMLDGKSKAGAELRQRNGAADPLKKTLVIIDEAHKLFAPDVAGSEKPDMEVIQAAFDRSRDVSGADGVKLLFMTATPYTSQPMDLIRLLNLLRPTTKKFPEDFEAFAERYLDDQGRFTTDGKLQYWDEITGYISYLNREKDLRTFSYPVFHEIHVPMTNYEFDTLIQDVKLQTIEYNKAAQTYQQGMLQHSMKIAEMEKKHKEALKKREAPFLLKHEDCTDTLKVDYIKAVKKHKKQQEADIAQCRKTPNECLTQLTTDYTAAKKALEADMKATKDKEVKKKLERDLKKLKHDFEFDSDECKDAHKKIVDTCIQLTKEEHEKDTLQIPKPDLSACDPILENMKAVLNDEKEHQRHMIERMKQQMDKDTKIDKQRMEQAKKTLDFLNDAFESLLSTDRSQRLRLEKCLNTKPAYQRLLKDDPTLMNVEIESGPAFDEETDTALNSDEIKKNMYLICGHGSEYVESVGARQRMPKDKILVVFPICSRPNYMDMACKFIHEYAKKEHRKLFADPVRNRDRIMQLIQQPMHVYLPGERVPNLSTDLFLIFKKPKEIALFKSGVFRITHLPEIDHNKLPKATHNLGSPLCNPYIGKIATENHFNKAVHHEMYKGNVFKPVQEKKGFAAMQSAHYSLQDIMASVGSGVYYYIGCRSATPVAPELYERILAKSEEQQKAEGRSKRLTDLEKILLHRGENADGSPIRTPSAEPTPTKTPSPPPEIEGERLVKSIKKIEKSIQETQEAFLKRYLQHGDGESKDMDMDAYDDLVVQWANELDAILKTRVKDYTAEEKERMRRKAILNNKKAPVFVSGKEVSAAYHAAHGLLEFFAYLRMHPTDYTVSYKVSTVAKTYRLFSRDATYEYTGEAGKEEKKEGKGKKPKTYKVVVSLTPFGCIPAKMRVADIKCSSERLEKQLLKLLSQNESAIVLPKIPEEWKAMSEDEQRETFKALCRDVWVVLEGIESVGRVETGDTEKKKPTTKAKKPRKSKKVE